MKTGGHALEKQTGFTIVETMVVLGVTGFIAVSAMLLISGRQAKTEFAVGARQIQQQFQQIINETESGYYPDSGSLKCEIIGTGIRLKPSGGSGQGTNGACIFVGKAIVIGGNLDKDSYRVFPLAGLRTASGGGDVKTPKEAAVAAIAPTPSGLNSTAPDLSSTIKLPNGLTFVGSRINNGTSSLASSGTYRAIAIMSSLAAFSVSTSGSDTTGAQEFSLREITKFNSAVSNLVKSINEEALIPSTPPPGPYPLVSGTNVVGVDYCFASGGTDQSVLVTIGTSLEVSTQIKDGPKCGL